MPDHWKENTAASEEWMSTYRALVDADYDDDANVQRALDHLNAAAELLKPQKDLGRELLAATLDLYLKKHGIKAPRSGLVRELAAWVDRLVASEVTSTLRRSGILFAGSRLSTHLAKEQCGHCGRLFGDDEGPMCSASCEDTRRVLTAWRSCFDELRAEFRAVTTTGETT